MGDGRGERHKEDGVNWLIQKRSGSGFLRKFLSVLFKSIESGAGVLNRYQMPSDRCAGKEVTHSSTALLRQITTSLFQQFLC